MYDDPDDLVTDGERTSVVKFKLCSYFEVTICYETLFTHSIWTNNMKRTSQTIIIYLRNKVDN